MPKIRHIEIHNFRCIRLLNWAPSAGINCLIGPGDSGKTSILDAIEACMSVRRSLDFSDADFFEIDVTKPILIRVTVGALLEHLMDLDSFGDVLRGFNATTGEVEDEPKDGLEDVLTLQLLVDADLDPKRTLYSQRTEGEPYQRQLQWKDRVALAPSRIGNHSTANLSWTKNSVLSRLSESKLAVGTDLVSAARDARLAFRERAAEQLVEVLALVTSKAAERAKPVARGADVQSWDDDLSLEEALFKWLPDRGIDELVKLAIELNSDELVGGALEQVSDKQFDLAAALKSYKATLPMTTASVPFLAKRPSCPPKTQSLGPAARDGSSPSARWSRSVNECSVQGLSIRSPSWGFRSERSSRITMAEVELNILEHRRGSINSPAGCGKTQLITAALLRSDDEKPALVLTHTNAGRAALEQRLRTLGVSAGAARVATLDSWAIRLVQCFPQRSGLAEAVLQVRGAAADYGAIRKAAVSILKAGHVTKIVSATYSRVIVVVM